MTMKYVLVIPDGCADESQASLGGKTPLQAAHTPHMDAIAAAGLIGRTDNVPADLPSGSDVGTMTLFGYDPHVYHTGRAPLEAAAMGIELADDDWAVRCNLVNVTDGIMRSFTAEQISNELGSELIGLLQKNGCGDEHWKYRAGVSYRNILVYRARGRACPLTTETGTTPPHDITDQSVESFLPKGPGSEVLRQMMDQSRELFTQHTGNNARLDAGESSATQIWLWGEGKKPALTPFGKRFGINSAVITAVDLLRGIGRILGWDIIEVPGATGYIDTDYAAKGRYAINTLAETDFVIVHVEATDEASHEGDADAKVKALEAIDRDIVGPVHDHLKSLGDYRLLVSPDHPTFLRTKTHSHGYVPFAMCGQGVSPDDLSAYDEITAESSAITLDAGHELMPLFIKQERIGG